MHKWFYSKWYSQLFRKGDLDTFLNFNYFVGDNRMKITFRRIQKGHLDDSGTLKSSKRLGDSFPPDKIGPVSNEETAPLTKTFNGRTITYVYKEAGNLDTFQSAGGYVVYLNKSGSDSINRINRLY